jgi:CBS domain-containing protein
MLVKEVMTGAVARCGPETNLAAAVEILWNRNCGFLPVVDVNDKGIGVVIDRDLCIANVPPSLPRPLLAPALRPQLRWLTGRKRCSKSRSARRRKW